MAYVVLFVKFQVRSLHHLLHAAEFRKTFASSDLTDEEWQVAFVSEM